MYLEWRQDVPATVTVELWGTEGRFVGTEYRGSVQPGIVRLPLTPTAGTGSFLCAVTVNGVRSVVPVTFMR